jgi:small-conductance mechanosensitive channel
MAPLLDLLKTEWVRDLGILLASAAVAYPFSYWLVRRIRSRRPPADQELRETRVVRDLGTVAIWPLTSMAVLVAGTELRRLLSTTPLGHPYQVLPILGFFLVYRLVNELVKDVVSREETQRRLRGGVIPTIFALAVLDQLNLLGTLLGRLERPFGEIGGVHISILSIVTAAIIIGLFIFGGRVLAFVLSSRVLPGVGVDRAIAEALSTVLRYLLIVLGFVVAFENLGFDLTTLQIGFGALGVGIGFGLQNFVNNFTSGVILLFERTVKKGDILTAAGTDGRVTNIGLRSSVMRTRQGDDIIVPNSMLVSERVTNYSYGDPLKRLDVDVGVSYDADPHHVERLLLEEAADNAHVLRHPKPTVVFEAFGDSALLFQLRAWIDNAWLIPQIRSELLFAIWYRFKEEGVVIPFPQRDIHVRSGELGLRRVLAGERGSEPSPDPGGRGPAD